MYGGDFRECGIPGWMRSAAKRGVKKRLLMKQKSKLKLMVEEQKFIFMNHLERGCREE
jgi:hypothetical protein